MTTHSIFFPVTGVTLTPTLTFTVYGNPQPRGSKTAGFSKGRTFMRDSNPKSYPWMRDVAQAAGIAMRNADGFPVAYELMRGALRVDVDFYLPRPKGHFGSGKNAGNVKASAPSRPITKPDKGKLERGTLDALEGVVYANDAQVVEGDSRKFYGEPARCEIRIFELSDDAVDLERLREVGAGAHPVRPHDSP
jgi:Holliday junction resolvase RusA-like endonuclease